MSDWFSAIDLVVQTLETGVRGTTVFVAPVGTVRRLPDAIGGDPNQWIKLQAATSKSKASFFELLRAKAHFLVLPDTIVTKLAGSSRVQLQENTLRDPELRGLTEYNPRDDTVVINIPSANLALARAASSLGRDNARNLDIFKWLYHEMTHAMIFLRKHFDDDFQKLCDEGFNAYQNAKSTDGKQLPAMSAFSEAAAYYVSDKLGRWCEALYRLDVVSRNTTQEPVFRNDELESIAFKYDVYGGPSPNVDGYIVESPDLSPALREAIDKQILDSCPLTKPFDETPLARLRDSLLLP